VGSGTWIANYHSTGVAGRTFGSGANQIFLPAAGDRYIDGMLVNVGTYGDYWSSVPNSANAYYLYFSSSNTGVANNVHVLGFSVRCVKEE
jgi:uncharacterized protein (TIGR02145 family)